MRWSSTLVYVGSDLTVPMRFVCMKEGWLPVRRSGRDGWVGSVLRLIAVITFEGE